MKLAILSKVLKFTAWWMAIGAFGVLLISAIFTPETLPKMPLCSFKQMTGRPCPGCGLTRAFCAISHGHIGDAFHYNPFAFFFYAGTVAIALWPLLVRIFPRLKPWFDRTKLFVWLVPAVLVGMLVFGVIRLFVGSDV